MLIHNSVTALKIEEWYIPRLTLCCLIVSFDFTSWFGWWFYISLRLARFPRNTIWISRLLQILYTANILYPTLQRFTLNWLLCSLTRVLLDIPVNYPWTMGLFPCNAHLTELEKLNKPRCATARPSDLHSKLLFT